MKFNQRSYDLMEPYAQDWDCPELEKWLEERESAAIESLEWEQYLDSQQEANV